MRGGSQKMTLDDRGGDGGLRRSQIGWRNLWTAPHCFCCCLFLFSSNLVGFAFVCFEATGQFGVKDNTRRQYRQNVLWEFSHICLQNKKQNKHQCEYFFLAGITNHWQCSYGYCSVLRMNLWLLCLLRLYTWLFICLGSGLAGISPALSMIPQQIERPIRTNV